MTSIIWNFPSGSVLDSRFPDLAPKRGGAIQASAYLSPAAAFTSPRQSSLRVIEIAREASADLARLAERSMRLQFSIQDGGVWVTNGRDNVQIEPRWLQGGERS